ncbi:MAG: DHH family phosphoesterase [Bacilli bacterium]|nr:DHH family phosphoesterase [Bacilli bacterium]
MDQFLDKLNIQIRKASNILIMSHRYMDLDGFGAALGISKIIEKYGRKPTIIVNSEEQDPSITKAVSKVKRKVSFVFKEKQEIEENIDDKTLLIILDVHKREMLEYPDLLDKVKNIVIVDHHIKGENMIEQATLSYVTTSVSSTVEIIVDYLKKEAIQIESVVSTIMLAGMYIDTNNFNVKTSSNTFLAASYLMENGADNILKQELFQENKKNFIRRQKMLKNSHMINNHMIVCILDKNVYQRSDLAKIAEELLQFEEVEASFAIGYVDENMVGVSSRSLGKINVERVMKQLGGGGHKTDAAATVQNVSLAKVQDALTKILN